MLGLAGLIFFLCFAGDCGTNSNGPGDTIDPIDLTFVDSPIDLQGNSALFAQNIAYGPYEENVFDIFLVDSEEPIPLIIYIHGGGFTSGSKGIVYLSARNEIRETLAGGASYATINYRLLEEVDDEGVLKCLNDSKRCIQFLRYHHEQLNIDPDRIALYGASAGAGTCLWMAFTDDMAEPGSDDPVLRESTRVSVIGCKGTQSTYDLMKWETVVFAPLGLTLEEMAALFGDEQGFLSFYGAETLEDLNTPEYQDYRASVDMLALMSADDPTFWVRNDQANAGIPADKGELQHHPLHAKALQDQAAVVGLSCQAYIPAMGIADPAGNGVIEYLLDRL